MSKFSLNNFLYNIKQIVVGSNGPTTTSNTGIPDGGIKVEDRYDLADIISASEYPAITDSTGGTASTTFAAITAGASYAQADMVAVKNALAQIAKIFNAQNALNNFANSGKSRVSTIASGTNPTIGTISFPVTRDYDENSDNVSIRLLAYLQNADANITITATPTVQFAGATSVITGAAVNGVAPFTTAALKLSQTPQIVQFDLKTSIEAAIIAAAASANLGNTTLVRDAVVNVTLAVSGTTTGNTNLLFAEVHYDSCIVSFRETDSSDSANQDIGNPLR